MKSHSWHPLNCGINASLSTYTPTVYTSQVTEDRETNSCYSYQYHILLPDWFQQNLNPSTTDMTASQCTNCGRFKVWSDHFTCVFSFNSWTNHNDRSNIVTAPIVSSGASTEWTLQLDINQTDDRSIALSRAAAIICRLQRQLIPSTTLILLITLPQSSKDQ